MMRKKKGKGKRNQKFPARKYKTYGGKPLVWVAGTRLDPCSSEPAIFRDPHVAPYSF